MKNVDSMKLVVYTQRQRDRERTFVPAHPGHKGVQIGLSSPVILYLPYLVSVRHSGH